MGTDRRAHERSEVYSDRPPAEPILQGGIMPRRSISGRKRMGSSERVRRSRVA